MATFNRDQLVEFYTRMIRIRMVEEKLMEVFSNGEIPGFIHVCIGQEATPVAVCSHLDATDYMANTHRGHGHALAKGIRATDFMAELFGRKNGPCRGRSGSMHLADPDLGILGANGIVGGGIPIACGAALSAKYFKNNRVAVCFFGEGATGEGTFHESLNLAAVLNLPVVFICENNQWAEFTPQTVHMGIRDVAERAAAYGIPGVAIPNDFFRIHEEAGKSIATARTGGGPSLIEVQSLRWHGHFVGDAQKYRNPENIETAMSADCIADFLQRLYADNHITHEEAEGIRKQVQEEILSAVEYARNSPLPDPSELLEELWV
ncbi:thiamine pyrophosphate-dependent dehydrogenase E1 component subunit alpha [Desulfatirhabdium butyrativorans]|uniref:thiamine pyrophosphate-dependent dehydrogenase E1 component subunit alpha n=1 Tax=Desulfatirhabdium butyrativorans TaxID=340467 RepID=UPI000489CD8A|nr:thiamine pyrophosphate-dependent dehydrogenase E1 component subunit alpha [Desulfatirhabdium butyrativorans]